MPWSPQGRQRQNGWWKGRVGWAGNSSFEVSPILKKPQVLLWHVGQALTCLQGALSSYVGTVSDAPCYYSFSGFVSGKLLLQQGVGSRIDPRPCTFLLFPAGASRTQETKSIQPYRRLLEEKCIMAFLFLDSYSFLQWSKAFLCSRGSTWYRQQVTEEK